MNIAETEGPELIIYEIVKNNYFNYLHRRQWAEGKNRQKEWNLFYVCLPMSVLAFGLACLIEF